MGLSIEDVAAEAILLAGGARAILLQIANPAVGLGVARHSDFADRPLDRLHGTLTYLYVINYGTPDEVRAVARRVGEAHAPVHGDGPEPGERYDARDENLQLWVAATLYDSAVTIWQLVYGALSPDDGERLLAHFARIGTTLGVPRELWPATVVEFRQYWGSVALRVDAPAQVVARELLHPAAAPLWMRAALPAVRVLTAGLLSPELREDFGLPHNEKRYRRLVRFVRAVYPRLPKYVRYAPMRHYLRRFRAQQAG